MFYYITNFTQLLVISICSDTMDSVKQSAALCLLRLYKTSPDLVLMGEWTSRVVHLLNDQHMVSAKKPHIQPHSWPAYSYFKYRYNT